MEVRPYTPMDRDACLALFDSNTPKYFLPQERALFEQWLDRNPANYFVLEHDGNVLACGGYVIPSAGAAEAHLVWGIVGQEWQRQGLGRFLLMYRMREIGRHAAGVQTISLETTTQASGFYGSQGFRIAQVVKDGYAPGRDKVEMIRKVAVCP